MLAKRESERLERKGAAEQMGVEEVPPLGSEAGPARQEAANPEGGQEGAGSWLGSPMEPAALLPGCPSGQRLSDPKAVSYLYQAEKPTPRDN